jgi:uncharacterized protein
VEVSLALVRTLLLSLTLLVADAAAAAAQRAACGGKNMLDELEGTPAHASILAKAAATENANALLWRVERVGGPPSHLFGTMHLTDERINTLSPALKTALAGSQRLLLEVDVEDLTVNGLTKAFARSRPLLTFTDGRRLDQLLSQAEYSKATSILERAGLPAQVAGAFRPWVATMMLALTDCERQRTAQGQPPLDQRLAREAQALGIATAGLETLDLQFRAMADVPEADQVEMLRASLRTYDRIDDMMETTIQLYLRRQLGAIWPLQLALAEKVGVAPAVFDSAERNLLVTRNLRMRDKALPSLAEGGAMIAVGALHLPGKQGLVALLREAGYTVTPVE